MLFLGDLTDEGEIANDIAFSTYYKRFKKIFQLTNETETMYVPGDNDIDGTLIAGRVRRFKSLFGNNTSLRLGNLQVYGINMMTNEIPPINIEPTNLTILISHIPVIKHPSLVSYTAVDTLSPSIIFTGHFHKSTEIIADEANLNYNWSKPINNFKVFDLDKLKKSEKIIEIQVPTCSYRMGHLTIGYAQAIFDNGLLKYSPLFVISRFYQLAFYLIIFILMATFHFAAKVKFKSRNVRYSRLTDLESTK